jgi:diphosphomevalonate decarboxylase
MSALAMCIVALEALIYESSDTTLLKRKASFLARLGSGSACRSTEGGLVVWGKHSSILGSSDLEGIAFPYDVHEVFKDYQDAILLVDKGEKQVSSSVGHNLMHNHPFAEQRFQQAHDHMDALIPILKSGDLNAFIPIVECEALTLHAMMMCSDPYFILMKPNTLEIINAIWDFRTKTQIPVCFTLDAGANVHVLYPKQYATDVEQLIQQKLSDYCQNGQYILDYVGKGVEHIKI